MKLPLYLRGLLLLTALICAWLFWQDQGDTPSMAPTPRVERPGNASPVTVPRSVSGPVMSVDVFPGQTWLPPPPAASNLPPPVPQPAPPPPLPFIISAQWRYQGQSQIVVLRGNDHQYTLCKKCSVAGHIRPGGLLGKDYRLDQLTDTRVVLTHLPSKHVSTLRLDAN